MEKIILVDGNNLLFRSYYATAYNGNFMKNSKGFPTNALFGFTNMMNKIILEEKPTYIMVAFDKGKSFRHREYDFYKGGRIETPDELKLQFPKAKELLNAMGIKYYEIDDYEADDIIGTFAKYCDLNPNFIGTIISSDKDLLQLISNDIEIKLLKQKDYIRYNQKTFKEEYGIEPINIIDLKSLMGDASDNIPGVKGIGEKTALKLLQQYKTLDGIYENIDNIKGANHDKLVNDKENAYKSYKIATIYKDVPLEFNIEDTKYQGNQPNLNDLYEELEFYSFLKKEEKKITKNIEYKILDNLDNINISECAIYLEILGTNYHKSKVLGIAIYNNEIQGFIPYDTLIKNKDFLKKVTKYTYDLKKTYVALKKIGIELENVVYDNMLAGYLLEYNVKDDISFIANQMDYDIPFYETVYGKNNKLIEPNIDVIAYNAILKAQYIYETKDIFIKKLKEKDLYNLYNDIELPLSIVLGDMEYEGINVSKDILDEMGIEIKNKIEELTKQIYDIVGIEFNISSTQQLGEILFDKLSLPHGKKGKTGYSTNIDVLEKLKDKHPIINLIIEYRLLTKLYTTYIEGLKNNIDTESKIHTIYTQALTSTGRLSSIEPNLQNIPTKNAYGKLIRKAFLPSHNSIIVSGDYSQIELRILAHIANVKGLIDAFNNDLDIHTKTASLVYNVKLEEVTKEMRSTAKAVNFGIVYGISGYGLSENTGLTPNEAKKFIDNYLNTYEEIKTYMDNTIKEVHDKKYVKTLFNRIRTIEEVNNTNYMIRQAGERMALNTPIQGTSADIIKKAMVEIHKEFKKQNIKSKMILQVHDELIFDTLIEEQDKVINIAKTIMENIIKLDVPLKVEFEKGNNWYEV